MILKLKLRYDILSGSNVRETLLQCISSTSVLYYVLLSKRLLTMGLVVCALVIIIHPTLDVEKERKKKVFELWLWRRVLRESGRDGMLHGWV